MSNKEELANVVDELVQRVIKVAEVADRVWVGDKVGPDLRSCADVIKQHLDQIVAEENKDNEESLRSLAIKNCANTFKHLENFDPKVIQGTEVKMFEILTTHSRDLFEIIHLGEEDQQPDVEEPIKEVEEDLDII